MYPIGEIMRLMKLAIAVAFITFFSSNANSFDNRDAEMIDKGDAEFKVRNYLAPILNNESRKMILLQVDYVPGRSTLGYVRDVDNFDITRDTYRLRRHCLDTCKDKLIELLNEFQRGILNERKCSGTNIVYKFQMQKSYSGADSFDFYVADHGRCVYFDSLEKSLAFLAPSLREKFDDIWNFLLDDLSKRSG